MSIRKSAKRRRSQAFPDQETASNPVETKQQSEELESVIENALVEEHDTTRDELEPGRISDEMEIDPAVPPENLEKEQEVWDAFREENYEAIEQLPLSLHRSFSLIHELDGQVQAQGTEILSAVRAYIERRRAMIKTVDDTPNTSQTVQEPAPDVVAPNDTSPPRDLPPGSVPSPPIQNSKPSETVAPIPSASCLEQSTRHMLTTIAQKSEDVVRASSEKVNLARFAYDLVDRYIKELDRAIQDQETSLSLGLRPGTHPASIILPAVVVPMDARGMSRIAHSPAPDVEELLPVDVEMETPTLGIFPTEHQLEEPTSPKQFRRKGRGKPRRKTPTAEPVELPVIEPEETPAGPTSGSLKLKLTVPPLTTVATQTQEPPDIVDPNEPRYCYCNQVSYGEMIACDNKECLREWFHLGCVGLAHAPKGKWFCRDCLEPTRKTPRRKAR